MKMCCFRCLPFHTLCCVNIFVCVFIVLSSLLLYDSIKYRRDNDEYEYYYDDDDYWKIGDPNTIGMDSQMTELLQIQALHPLKSTLGQDNLVTNCNMLKITGYHLSDEYIHNNCRQVYGIDIQGIMICESENYNDKISSILAIKSLLKTFPKLGLIDINPGAGLFSLIPAAMGRNVVAIESVKEIAENFAKTVLVNGATEEHIILLHNVLKTTTPFNTTAPAIFIDDVMDLTPFTWCILHLRVRNHEHLLLIETEFITRINILFIFMDWKEFLSTNPMNVQDFIDNMEVNEYKPCHVTGQNGDVQLEAIEDKDWKHWPANFLWKSNKI